MMAHDRTPAIGYRKAFCFWALPNWDMSKVLLEPDGRSYQVYSDAPERRWWERGCLYVIEEDGDRTYLMYS